MSLDLSTVGIDPSIPEHRALLANLQGNILKPHGREFVRLLLLRFTTHPSEVRRWLWWLTHERVTSALTQLEDAERFRRRREGAGPATEITAEFCTLALSAKGYKYLGFEPAAFRESPPPLEASPNRSHTPFVHGLFDAADSLGDQPDTWEKKYRSPFDALVLLAHEDSSTLDKITRELRKSLGKVADIASETGQSLRDDCGRVIEHFGFADGLSQPLFLASDLEEAARSGAELWDPSAPLSLVLAQDPFATAGAYGSYLVYRKLEQDVEAFRAEMERLAKEFGISLDLAAAQAVGRFSDGTPVLLSPIAKANATSNFEYSEDGNGHRCPFHAHIRKMNPRGDTVRAELDRSLESERKHRIVRRGIPYGAPSDSDRGLLFLCYQSDISTQFAHLQGAWAGNPHFVNAHTGIDPIVGPKISDEKNRQVWLTGWNGDRNSERIANHSGFVTLRGGEFFFAPSLLFLRGLA